MYPLMQPQQLGNDGLVLQYLMDEGTGRKVCDTSGKGNTGTLINGPTWGVGAKGKGFGLKFDGVDDYVDCGNDSSLDVLKTIYVGCWFQIFSVISNYPFIIEKEASNTAWQIQVQQTAGAYLGNLFLRFYDGSATQTINASGLLPSKWYYAEFIHDGVTGSFCIDGVLIGSVIAPFNPAVGGKLKIGGEGSAWMLNGQVGEVRIYNRALPTQERQRLYEQVRL